MSFESVWPKEYAYQMHCTLYRTTGWSLQTDIQTDPKQYAPTQSSGRNKNSQ